MRKTNPPSLTPDTQNFRRTAGGWHRPGIFCVLGCCLAGSVLAGSDFDEVFLRRDKGGATPDVFVWQDAVTPGMKLVDIRVNDNLAEHTEVHFVDNGKQRVAPCLTREQLISLGIKIALYDDRTPVTDKTSAATGGDATCEPLEQKIPSSAIAYDATHQVLSITVPQEAVDRQRFTMISPDEWDHGIPSLRTSYNGYFYTTKTKGRSGDGWRTDDSTSRSAYLNLNTVGSLGTWRFFSIDSFYRNPGKSWESSHDRSYLSRDIAFLRSNLQAGEIYTSTSGYMVGAIPLTGVSLSTSQKMLLDNQFSYSPVVRGVARTNARLVIRQRGNIIYSTTLTPGPFAIDDLYSAQVGADLEVTVEESDGQVQVFHVPYTALPNMIRPGTTRYSLAAGRYRNQGRRAEEPWVTTGSLERGFEHFTLNSSAVASEDYQSLSAGVAWNVGNIGAFSTEAAWARHQETWNDGEARNGSAVRFLYARHFDMTGTSLQILGYQYRSKNFLEFPEFLSRQSRDNISGYSWGDSEWLQRKHSRVEMTLNQSLNNYGSLYMGMSQDRYYGTSRKTTSITGGAGTTIGPASVSLSLTRTHDIHNSDTQIGLSISLPLGSSDSRSRDYGSLNYSLSRNSDNQYSQSLGYTGSAWDNRVNYSANMMRDTQGKYSQSGTLGYNGSKGNVSAGMSHSSGHNQYSAGMSGGITLYGGGLVLSPTLGNTVAIVETPGASGISVSGAGNTETDYFGHAMVTWLTPYRYNNISLDTSSSASSQNVELKDSARKVVPSDGAAVLLKFATRVGRRAMVEIQSPKKIPLGAMIYLEGEKEEAGIVGNHGQAYLSGLDARRDQTLKVVWGKRQAEQCQFTLPALPEGKQAPEDWYKKVTVNCH